MDRPLLIFDGDCSFCRAWIARWKHVTGDRVDYAPWQEVAGRFAQIPVERFKAAVQLVEPDGRVSQAAEAVFRSLAHAPGHGGWLWGYRYVPGFAAISEWAYARIARHRNAAERITKLLWGRHLVPPGETVTAWIYIRLIGLVYLAAFASLLPQIVGLHGSHGILPARDYLEAIRQHFGAVRYLLAPTVFWLGSGDGALVAACAAGAALAVLLIAGAAPVPLLIALWFGYLSLVAIGQDFLSFQWDALLLEAGLLAILLAPRCAWSRPRRDPPPRPALWLSRWLLFRLMISSAAVKLASGDPTWRGLTALTYHYQTQPLPPWTAWYAHHLPLAWHRVEAAVMFGIEGLAPFLIFAPRRARFLGAALLALLQVLIAITGNYGFFNLLALALCLLLLDDGVWPWRWCRPADGASPGHPRRGRVLAVAAIVLFALSLVPLVSAVRGPVAWLGPLPALETFAEPFHVVNPYGLFAVMTTRRNEIVLEGSRDGVRWEPYEFRWKPGDPNRRPDFMAPHMPRLDWQMWFAALADFRQQSWFLSFCQRLLEGSRPVTALLARDPFPGRPPRYLRAVVYDYRFTDAATRRATGAWWTREPLGLYCPVLTLVNGKLAAVGPPSTP